MKYDLVLPLVSLSNQGAITVLGTLMNIFLVLNIEMLIVVLVLRWSLKEV